MIYLWEKEVPGYNPDYPDEKPSITPYCLNVDKPHGAVIVVPGGGYEMKAPHEGEPIALWLNSIGLSAFVLDYRVAPYKYPYPLVDAQRAIRYVRYNFKKLNIDPQKIGILGFSAGGHLACTAGTHFDTGDINSIDPIDRVSSRPDTMVLCYPVISFGEYRHHGSMVNLIGENPADDLRYNLSNENAVCKDTPPAFLWHTADDSVVPVENSLLFASALSKHKVPFELHIFPNGTHGLGLAPEDRQVNQWTDLCIKWFEKIKFI